MTSENYKQLTISKLENIIKLKDELIELLQVKNKDLKEENEKLKRENDCQQLVSYIESQKRQIEKLKEEDRKTTNCICNMEDVIKKLKKDNEELQSNLDEMN